MRQGLVRWMALALVGAMVAALAIGLVGGRGGGSETPDVGDGDAARADVSTAAPLDGPHVLVELCTGATCPAPDEAAQQALVDDLEADPRVASAVFVSSEQAYELFLEEFGDREDLVASVQREDVPARVELNLHDPAGVPEVAADHEQHPAVAGVYDARTVAP